VRWLPSLLVAVLVTAPSLASAFDSEGQVPPEPWEKSPEAPPRPADATAGNGFDVELGAAALYLTPPIHGGTNPFGAGFGARLGMSISGLYLGVRVADFLGGKDVDISYQSLLLGAEVGYGPAFRVFEGGLLTLRPQVGVGLASVSYTDPSLAKPDVVTSASGRSSSSTPSDTITVSNVYVEPALVVMLSSSVYFVALQGSALVVPGITYGSADATTWLSFGASGQLGFRF
jgi:hypothetical protein